MTARKWRRHVVVAVMLVAATRWPAVASAQVRFDSAKADAIFADFAEEPVPGCALGVVQDGSLVYGRGYGLANLERDGLRPGLTSTLETRGTLKAGVQIPYATGQRHGGDRGLATLGHGGSFVGFRADAAPAGRSLRVADVVLAYRPGTSPADSNGPAAADRDDPTTSEIADPSTHAGTYHSPQLDVDYHFIEVDGGLRLRVGQGVDEPVRRLAGDTSQAGFSTLRFPRESGGVTDFELDSGRVVHLRFTRTPGRR